MSNGHGEKGAELEGKAPSVLVHLCRLGLAMGNQAHLVGCKATTNNVGEKTVEKKMKERLADCSPSDVGTAHLIGGYTVPKLTVDYLYCKAGVAIITSPHPFKWSGPSCDVTGKAGEVKWEMNEIKTEQVE